MSSEGSGTANILLWVERQVQGNEWQEIKQGAEGLQCHGEELRLYPVGEECSQVRSNEARE